MFIPIIGPQKKRHPMPPSIPASTCSLVPSTTVYGNDINRADLGKYERTAMGPMLLCVV